MSKNSGAGGYGTIDHGGSTWYFVREAGQTACFVREDFFEKAAKDREAWQTGVSPDSSKYKLTNKNSPSGEPYFNWHVLRLSIWKEQVPDTYNTDGSVATYKEVFKTKDVTAEYGTMEGIKIPNSTRGNLYWKKFYKREYWNGSEFVKLKKGESQTDPKFIVETDENGRITIKIKNEDKKIEYYFAKEIEAPKHYKKYNDGKQFILNPDNPIEAETEETQTINVTIKDEPITVKLKLHKQETHCKAPIQGAKFKFKSEEYGWVVQDGEKITYSEDENDATWFETNGSGEIVIDGLMPSKYHYVEEVPRLFRALNDNPEGDFELVEGTDGNVTVENEQYWVDLSGYVWVDDINAGKQESGTGNGRDNLYNSNTNDALMDNITVRLKDKTTGEVVNETITSNLPGYGHGAYVFRDVLINKLQDYYIEFEYDGLKYTNVDIVAGWPENGTKAIEGDERRRSFNNSFETIQGPNSGEDESKGHATGNGSLQNPELGYEIKDEGNVSTATFNTGGVYTYSGEGPGRFCTQDLRQNYPLRYPIYADTNEAGYTLNTGFEWMVLELKNINLGVYERDQADLSLKQDLILAHVNFNKKQYTYNYGDKYKRKNWTSKGKFNVGVKFGQLDEDSNVTYSRAIYKKEFIDDYTNEGDAETRELRVYLTYEIQIENNSPNGLKAKVNGIIDKYDSRYIFDSIGTKIDENGNITENNSLSAEGDTETNKTGVQSGNGYNTLTITSPDNIYMDGNEFKSIYIRFKINRDTVKDMLDGKPVGGEGEELDNFAEINSYSCRDDKGIYAAIDVDSNPGNRLKDEFSGRQYEDDEDASPSLKLKVAQDRVITGSVFLDDEGINPELQTDKERIGDGKFNSEKESKIKGVKVKLTEVSGAKQEICDDVNNDGVKDNGEVEVDENGDFKLENFGAGDYVISYTWGNNTVVVNDGRTINVQEYKGTIYNNKERANSGTWYYDEGNRYSDAIDLYDSDERMDAENKGFIGEIDDTSLELLSRNEIDEAMKDITQVVDTSKITASLTPVMNIEEEYKMPGDMTIQTAPPGGEFVVEIPNIDFGIVERPRQQINISKDVTRIKITLANGLPLMDAKVENGKLVGDALDGLTYMAPNGQNKGFVKAEIDNELIQGATVQIEYKITVENKSERDYEDEGYYKYGTDKNHVVKITPTVYDYFDNQMLLDSYKEEDNKNTNKWTDVVESGQYNEDIYAANDGIYATDTDRNLTPSEKWFKDMLDSSGKLDPDKMGSIKEEYQRAFSGWDLVGSRDTEARDKKLNDKSIVKNESDDLKLEPNQKSEKYLYTSKILMNTDEIDLNNDAEFTKIVREDTNQEDPSNHLGRIPDIRTSTVYDQAETVTVTTPTGKNLAYIVPVSIGVSALVILGVGVILIKKKVVDK